MRTIKEISFIALAAASLLLTGCERRPVDEVAAISASREPAIARHETAGMSTSGTSGTGGTSASSSSATDDEAINSEVMAALLADGDVKGSSINVETKAGKVILSGHARNRAQIERASNLAHAVEGVKAVDNKMIVKQ